jgi:hypothetical protein
MAGSGRPISGLSVQPSSRVLQCLVMWFGAAVFLFITFGLSGVYWVSVSKHGLSNDLSLGTAIGQGLGLFGLPFCGVMLLRAVILDTIKLFHPPEK